MESLLVGLRNYVSHFEQLSLDIHAQRARPVMQALTVDVHIACCVHAAPYYGLFSARSNQQSR